MISALDPRPLEIFVFAAKFATAHPKPDNNFAIWITPVRRALTTHYGTDAHFVAYTAGIKRRVSTQSIGQVPIDMNLLVADVDGPEHVVKDDWRNGERAKIANLIAKHPGAFVYETRGGYRVMFRLPAPFKILTPDDKTKWWAQYEAYRSYLAREFLISSDPACKDFTRCYRLPDVVRDGKSETFPTYGDPDVTEALTVTPAPARPRAPKYVKAALDQAEAEVRTAVKGDRNNALNKAAFSIGGFVPKYLDRDLVFDTLLHAILANGGDPDIDAKKIDAAIDAGMSVPREVPIAAGIRTAANGGGSAGGMQGGGASTPDDASTAAFTDLANAEMFVAMHREKARYVKTWQRWIFWDGSRWKLDADEVALGLACQTARVMYADAQTRVRDANARFEQVKESGSNEAKAKAESARQWAGKYLAWAIKSQGRARLEAIVALASAVEGIAIDHTVLDQHAWLLNVENGTIDLRTGMIRPHLREDLITKLAPVTYDPTATCPTWDKFLNDAMGGDVTMIDYLARLIGYSLTAEIRDHMLVFFHGPKGANGKGTFVRTILNLLGEYGAPAARHLLFRGRGERHPTEIADLHGLRFVACSEIEENRTFDEALLKDLTGGDHLKARRMRENFWSFVPTHKLFIAGNHKPIVRGDDGGIWRRIKLVPWLVSFEGKENTQLGDELWAERSGILNWALKGCASWQRDGLAEPSNVREATQQYRDELNPVNDFVRDRCVVEANAKVSRQELLKAYERYCRDEGATNPPNPKTFAAGIRTMGFEETSVRTTWIDDDGTRRSVPGKGWRGIRLQESSGRKNHVRRIPENERSRRKGQKNGRVQCGRSLRTRS